MIEGGAQNDKEEVRMIGLQPLPGSHNTVILRDPQTVILRELCDRRISSPPDSPLGTGSLLLIL